MGCRGALDGARERARLALGIRFAQMPQQHREFIAAEPGDQVGSTHMTDKCGRYRLEHGIAAGVTVAVIDRLEAVEIEIEASA
jgi:hypothetical protein